MSMPTDPRNTGSSPEDPQAAYGAATVSISADDARRLMEGAEQAEVPGQAPAVGQEPAVEVTSAPEVTTWDDSSQETVTVDQGTWRSEVGQAAAGEQPVPGAEEETMVAGQPQAYGSAQSPAWGAAQPQAAQPDPSQQSYAQQPDPQVGYTQPDASQQAYTQPGYTQDQQAWAGQQYAQSGAYAGAQSGYAYSQAPQPGYGAPAYAGQPIYGQKSKLAAGLLGIFLGSLGIHNFYLGYTGKALAQLLITVLTLGFGALVTSIWGLIEGILILTAQPGAPTWGVDAKGVPLAN